MHEFCGGSTARDVDRRLWLELTPEQYAMVRELVRLESDAPILGLLTECERLVDALAGHFPGMGPAIRAVAQHIIERGAIYDEYADLGSCCAGGAPLTEPSA